MPRCKKHRCCRFLKSDKIFKPRALPLQGMVLTEIFLDEFEAVRLCDHESLSQIEAAGRMSISRGTVQRLLESGRFKIVDGLLHDKAIKIDKQ
jgi:predicted DNA-binding protein (UPF0251 family)